MRLTGRRRLELLLHHGLFVVLLVALGTLLAYLAREFRYEHDLTLSHRNTLAPATLELLARMEGPVTVTAYVVARNVQGDNVHRRIEESMRPYQRAKPDITLALVDPREQPQAAARAGVRAPFELVVEYRQRSEHLTEFNEQAFGNVLTRLARGADRFVMWLDGHGERKLDGRANHDLGEFGRQLEQKGFRLNSVNLALAQEVPTNTALLVIASPQVNLLPLEVQKIRRYLAGGGNLLWLIDPEPLRGLAPVAEMLGLVLTPGTVVDPLAAQLNAPAAFAVGVAAGYGRHPVTAALDRNTVFPFARQVGVTELEEWRATPLVDVAQRGWVETGSLEGKLSFDRNRDFPGPVTIAVAFERQQGARQQRVVVVGNGHFLSNAYLGNGGNLPLGVNIVNWLSGDDRLVTLQPRIAADSAFDIPQPLLILIALTFLFALPLAFVATGAVIWWRRRRL
jgi:ABC-type uncharacterized transport system involved in gliding motility auxiliary subunit